MTKSVSGPTILAIDQGTTSTRAILFSAQGTVLNAAQKELKLHCPQKSWVEQDPEDIWQDTLSVCRDVLDYKEMGQEAGQSCAVIGIANQRETVILWDRRTGRPLYNAIVWQDRRTLDFCEALRRDGHEDLIAGRTGLLSDPYFSAPKIRWILDHVDGARAAADQGHIAFGTVDCFLLWRLSGGAAHATDITNASRTGLFNIVTMEWDQDLLDLYNVPRAILPEVKDNAAPFGHTAAHLFGRSLAIGGMAGDQQAALIGHGGLAPGLLKCTYGTGCFALMNIGATFRRSASRLLTTPAFRVGGRVSYALEGSVFVAGAAVQWLRDNLGLIVDAAETESLARSVPDNQGVYMVPAFAGLGAPHWRPDVRGGIFGLSRDSGRAHIVRAALEAQAYQTRDLMAAMQDDGALRPNALRIDGGLAGNDFVCQFLADILQIPVERPAFTEMTALGASYLAGVQAGIYQDLQSAAQLKDASAAPARFAPSMPETEAARLYETWRCYLGRLM